MSFNPTYPYELPLLPPKLDLDKPEFSKALLKARTELAELKGYSFSMPNPMLLISPAIIRESVASSDIENIHTTIVDVLQNQLFPEAEQRQPDKEVLRYRDAVLWGYKNLQSISLSTRLILGVHKELLPHGHDGYRKLQNHIKNTTTGEVLYTPPKASDIPTLIGNWENFINLKTDEMDPLVKCAIGHYQFESIHPFEDGNGRTGRILMVMQLVQDDILSLPILYISGYINAHKSEYYRLFRGVASNGKWDDFILFMLRAFHAQALETKEYLMKMMKCYFDFKDNLKKNHKKIYSADLAEELFTYPVISPVKLAKSLGIHYTTASRHLLELAKAGLLKEGKYGKYHLFINEALIKIMKK
jgi:Fic family protein